MITEITDSKTILIVICIFSYIYVGLLTISLIFTNNDKIKKFEEGLKKYEPLIKAVTGTEIEITNFYYVIKVLSIIGLIILFIISPITFFQIHASMCIKIIVNIRSYYKKRKKEKINSLTTISSKDIENASAKLMLENVINLEELDKKKKEIDKSFFEDLM